MSNPSTPLPEQRMSMNGFSMFVCFGKWATPTIQFGSFIRLRICLGFVAISFYTIDMENFLTMLMKERRL